MGAQLLTVFYVSSVAIALGVLIIEIYGRRAPNFIYYSYLVLMVFILAIGRLFEFAATSFPTALVAVRVIYVVQPFIMPFLFLFVLEYSEIRLKKRYIASLLTIPVVSTVLVLTWPFQNIFFGSLEFVNDSIIPHIQNEETVFFHIAQIYNIIVALAACVSLFVVRYRGDKKYHKQTIIIIAVAVLPVIAAFLNVFDSSGFDYTPGFLGTSCLLMSISNLSCGCYRVAPLTREQMVEAMSDGYVTVDMQGHFLDANLAAKRILPQLALINIGDKLSEAEDISWLRKPSSERRGEFSVQEANGSHRHYQLSETDVMDSGKTIARCIMIFDVTDAKKLLEEASHLAERDALTGLYNRRTLFGRGEHLFNNLTGGDIGACALMIDIDFFKTVNDTYGHIQGDEVLKTVATVLSSHFRTTDLLARYGGEEFSVFLPEITEQLMIENARKLRERVETLTFDVNTSTFGVTISIGVSVYDPTRHLSFDALIADADAALYTAKNSGRNTIYLAKPTTDSNGISDGQITFICALKPTEEET